MKSSLKVTKESYKERVIERAEAVSLQINVQKLSKTFGHNGTYCKCDWLKVPSYANENQSATTLCSLNDQSEAEAREP